MGDHGFRCHDFTVRRANLRRICDREGSKFEEDIIVSRHGVIQLNGTSSQKNKVERVC